MDSLLRWGITNSVDQPTQPAKLNPTPLDSKYLDAIIGPSDADQMRTCMASAVDKSASVENRVRALDNFELLVESIDNAIDLKNLGMYPQLITLASSAETSEEVRKMALWILATAVQGNPKAQQAFLEFDPIPALLTTLKSSTDSAEIQAKSLYCLSALLRHNPEAVDRFILLSGSDLFSLLLARYQPGCKPDIPQKVLFLLHALLMQDKRESAEFEQTAQDERFKCDIDNNTRSKWTTDGTFLAALPSSLWSYVLGQEKSDLAVQCVACALARGVKLNITPEQIMNIKTVLSDMAESDFAEGWQEISSL